MNYTIKKCFDVIISCLGRIFNIFPNIITNKAQEIVRILQSQILLHVNTQINKLVSIY